MAAPRPRPGGREERGRASHAPADPVQATEHLETVEPPAASVPAPPLGLLGSVMVAAVGLLVAVIAVKITTSTLASSGTVRAQAQLTIALPETGGDGNLVTRMAGGQPAKAATAVLVDRDVVSRATAGVAGSPVISAVATPEMITLTVTASTAAAAERVAQAVVDIGVPAAAPIIGPLRLVEIGSPAGTAISASWSAGMVTAVTAPVAFLLGLLLALVTRWGSIDALRGRPKADLEAIPFAENRPRGSPTAVEACRTGPRARWGFDHGASLILFQSACRKVGRHELRTRQRAVARRCGAPPTQPPGGSMSTAVFAFNPLSASDVLTSFGTLGILVVLVAETGLLIGFFLPGDSLLFTAGLLCSTGAGQLQLSLPWVLAAAAAGAVIGAQIGYVIGRGASAAVRRGSERPRLASGMRRAEELLAQYGPAKAIVLARFIPVVRTVLNPMAGLLGTPVGTFTIWQVVGGLVWTVGLVLAGYALGATVPGIDGYLLPVIALIVVVSLLPLARELVRERRSAADRRA